MILSLVLKTLITHAATDLERAHMVFIWIDHDKLDEMEIPRSLTLLS